MEIRKMFPFSAIFVEYGTVRIVFVHEKDTTLEQKTVVHSDLRFAINAMINF